jgi:hypothetical protein
MDQPIDRLRVVAAIAAGAEQHKRLIASLEASLAADAIDPADAERVISFCESLWDAKLAVLNSLLAEP